MTETPNPILRVPHTMHTDLYLNFVTFHRDNPDVWKKFKEQAFKMISTGRRNYSARVLIHWIVWHTHLQTTTQERDFKVCNNHTPYYARLFNQEYPDYIGFFSLRRVSGEPVPSPWASNPVVI